MICFATDANFKFGTRTKLSFQECSIIFCCVMFLWGPPPTLSVDFSISLSFSCGWWRGCGLPGSACAGGRSRVGRTQGCVRGCCLLLAALVCALGHALGLLAGTCCACTQLVEMYVCAFVAGLWCPRSARPGRPTHRHQSRQRAGCVLICRFGPFR
jgi:hypothetical protein